MKSKKELTENLTITELCRFMQTFDYAVFTGIEIKPIKWKWGKSKSETKTMYKILVDEVG